MAASRPCFRGFRQAARPLLCGALLVAGLLPTTAPALDFGSVSVDRAVLYDGPTLQAKKLFVVSRYYPLEVIVTQGQWVKVRDGDGSLSWIEKKDLGDARVVAVTAARADIRQSAEAGASLVFQAERDVALELVEKAAGGWAKVRHRDGQAGYIRIDQVWGL
jgi:SH3-like domain-containing protein